MALIKCPQCGHTVLSVASQCPACATALAIGFLGPEHRGELAECRSCGHPVRSGTRTCPHCGIQNPARGRRVRQQALRASAVLILAVLALGIRARLSNHDAARAAAAPQQEPAHVADAAPERSSTVAAPEVVASEAAASPLEAVPLAPPVNASAPPPETRWTATWANVREQPKNDAPILRVLAPGTPVKGTLDRYGWWLVHLEGKSVGYVAGELLSAR